MKDRILKGIEYFRSIKPSKFNASHKAHLNLLLNLMEEHITGKQVGTRVIEKPTELMTEEEIFK